MTEVVQILCPGGDVETVDLALNPAIAKRIEDGELSIVEEKPKAAKAKAKADQGDEA